MKIKRIVAKNFCSYKDIDIDIENLAPITVITGVNYDESENGSSNGAGKTSLTSDLFAYGLFGQTIDDKQLKDLVNDDSEEEGMEVSVWVDNYRIQRKFKKKSSLSVFRLFDNGEEEDITTVDIQNVIESEWGIDFKTFCFLFRFGGGETSLPGYVKSPADFKRKIQDALIQADKITKCLKVARKFNNEIKKNIAIIQNEIQHHENELVQEENELNNEKKKIESNRIKAEQELEVFQEEFVKLSKIDFENAREILQRKLLLLSKKEKEELKNDFEQSNLNQILKEIENEKSEIENLLAQYENLPKEIKLDDLNSNKDNIEKKILIIEKKIEKLSSSDLQEEDLLRAKIANSNERIKKGKNELEEHKEKINNFKDLVNPDQLYQKCKNKKVELENKIEEFEKQLFDNKKKLKEIPLFESYQSIVSQIKFIENQNESIELEISDLKKDLSDIQNLKPGTKCPTCNGEINPNNIEEPINSIAIKISKLENVLSANENKIETLKSISQESKKNELHKEKLENDRDEIEKCIDDLKSKLKSSIENNLEVLKKEWDNYNKKQAEIDFSIEKIELLKTEINSLESQQNNFKVQLEELTKQKRELFSELKILKENLSNTNLEIEEIVKNNANIENKKQILTLNVNNLEQRLKELRVQKNKLKGNINEIKSNIKKIDEELEKLNSDDNIRLLTLEELGNMENRKTFVEKRLHEIQEILNSKVEDSLELSNLLQKINSRKEKINNSQKKLNEEEDNKKYYDFWTAAFESDGIRSLVMRDVLPLLNSQCRKYREILSGKLAFELDEELNPNIWRIDSGETFKYSKCSGGQKKRVNIAIALAFLETIRMSASCDLNVFVVDEAADALDTMGMHCFAEALQESSKDRNIFVISHNPVLTEYLIEKGADELRIEYRNSVSKVVKQ